MQILLFYLLKCYQPKLSPLNPVYIKTDSLSSYIPPKVGVILLPYGNSVIETLRFQWYFIRPNTAEGNITWTLVQIQLLSNITRLRRIKLALYPYGYNAFAEGLFCAVRRGLGDGLGAKLRRRGVSLKFRSLFREGRRKGGAAPLPPQKHANCLCFLT